MPKTNRRQHKKSQRPFELVWHVANWLRLTAGQMHAHALIKRERGEPAPSESVDKITHRLFRLQFAVTRAELQLPPVIDDPQKVMYRLRVVTERLSREWLPFLKQEGPLSKDAEQWLSELHDEALGLGMLLDHAVSACRGPSREPLSEAARLVYEHLCSLPETKARTEKDLVAFLATKGTAVGENRVRKGINAELRPYGLRHKPRRGYYIPVALRPESEEQPSA